MVRRPSSPDNRPVSAKIDLTSVLTPGTLERTVSEVQVAAKDEQARLSKPLVLSARPWYRRKTAATVLALAAVAVWGTQSLVWKRPPRALPERDRDAALRYAMAQQIARIEEFRARTLRLPRSLGEVAETYRGMTYVVLDSLRYRVTAKDDRLVLAFRSDSSMRAFLGGSVLAIREHRK